MSEERQIEEMAHEIFEHFNCRVREEEAERIAKHLVVNAGYRKQSEGEWIGASRTHELICNLCGAIGPVDCLKEDFYESNFCPNCGAKMKGGAE